MRSATSAMASAARHMTMAEIERNAAAIVASVLGMPRASVELRRSSRIPPRLTAEIVGPLGTAHMDLSSAMVTSLLASDGRILRPRSGSITRALRSRGLLVGTCIATDLAVAVRHMLRAAVAAEGSGDAVEG